MENRPEVLSWLAERFHLVGSSPAGIARARSPLFLRQLASEQKFLFPKISLRRPAVDSSKLWLAKPFRSAGGSRIRYVCEESNLGTLDPSEMYFQEFVDGKSYGTTFLVDGDDCRMIGTAEQIIGDVKFGALPGSFTYCGSGGPVKLSANVESQVAAIGKGVAEKFGLNGVYGIDWLLDHDSWVWLIEINPRVPASAELYERAKVIDSVFKANAGQAVLELNQVDCFYGKAVLYSNLEESKRVCDEFSMNLWAEKKSSDHIADIPLPGSIIAPRAPICSLFGSAKNYSQLRRKLELRAQQILQRAKKLESVSDSSLV